MIWGLAFLACMVLAIVIAVQAMRDQRRKGKGGFAAFVAGVFVGGFTGGFFIVVLGILALIFGDFSDEPDTADSVASEQVASIPENSAERVAGVADDSGAADDPLPDNALDDRRSEIEAGNDLGIGVGPFVERFNELMSEAELPYRADGQLENTEGVQATFQENFSEHMALLGTAKPEVPTINGLMLMGTGDGTAESGAQLMVVAAGVFAASQPSLSMESGLETVIALLETFEQQGEQASRTVNDLVYTYERNELMGNLFTVGSVEE